MAPSALAKPITAGGSGTSGGGGGALCLTVHEPYNLAVRTCSSGVRKSKLGVVSLPKASRLKVKSAPPSEIGFVRFTTRTRSFEQPAPEQELGVSV